MPEIPKAYDPKEVEDKIYKKWEESGVFNPDNLDLPANAEVFSVAMPPPNVTGILHLGHALENTLMDTMIRYQRMQGKRALLIPGTDHAAVATQARVEKDLVKSGQYKNPREELGREKLLEIIREYSEKSKAAILSQIRKMGTSCDWSRLAYTFDESRSRAVNEVFTKMYRDGLIYRGYRVVNWSVKGQSTCSDDELVHIERPAKLYTFRYSKDFPISIATTRPETKLGDTAVAVNPKDDRYKKYIGQIFTVDIGAAKPLQIKIIADEGVDFKFGTGALGVTPAHSMVDYEMAGKNKLPVIKVIGEDGKMTAEAGKEYAGLTVLEAREKFVGYLRKEGLLEKEEDIVQNVGTSDRFGDVAEVLPMTQWFVDVNKKIPGKKKSLKDLMREAVTIGHNGKAKQKINITPDRFGKIYLNWIENLRDWCISRQMWWGHRIPIFYDMSDFKNSDGWLQILEEGNYIELSIEMIKKLPAKYILIDNKFVGGSFSVWNYLVENKIITWGKIKLIKWDYSIRTDKCKNPKAYINENEIPESAVLDPDTLDTWFSSGLWTFSTLGWPSAAEAKEGKPEKTKDFKSFHPTSWMQMGSDLIFFWLARMILMSTYVIDQIPFKDVYLHGLLRDKSGKKFSKSLGNNIDPLEIIKKYGADALRLSVIIGNTPGNDAKFYDEKVEGYRNFVNKLWNISRFILTAVSPEELEKAKDEGIKKLNAEKLTVADKWILVKLSELVKSATKNLDKYNFSAAGEDMGRFMRDDLADWYLEVAKIEIRNIPESKKEKDIILVHCLITLLKLLHPFIPFVTEEIWDKFNGNLLITEHWPDFSFKKDGKNTKQFSSLQNIIIAVRNLRSENKIEPVLKLKAVFIAGDAKNKKLLESGKDILKGLARLSDIAIETEKRNPPAGGERSVSAFAEGTEIYLSLEGTVDVKKELERIDREIKENENIVLDLQKRLSNEAFVSRAKKEVVEETREKLKISEDALIKLKERKKLLV